MSWGGARVGAGRKPRAERGVVLGMDGLRKTVDLAPSGDDEALLTPPAGLTAAQARYWRLWAPLAIAQRTLTRETVPGFREACELAAMKEPLAKRIRRVGPERSEARELVRDYLKFSKDLRTALQQYKLGAFGKPEAVGRARTKTVSSPWEAVGK